jgi:hypothetical protein
MARSGANTALLASAFVFLGAYALPRSETAHNPNNPHRHLLARAVTADPTKLSGKSFDFVIVGWVERHHGSCLEMIFTQ